MKKQEDASTKGSQDLRVRVMALGSKSNGFGDGYDGELLSKEWKIFGFSANMKFTAVTKKKAAEDRRWELKRGMKVKEVI